MLDLGKYANAILSSWVISLGLVVALIVVTWVQARKSRRDLEAAEARVKGKLK